MAVCVDKPADLGIIVAALEVIEARFSIVIIAAVAKGIELGDGRPDRSGTGAAVRHGKRSAPCVVGVFGGETAAAVDQRHNVALQVGDVVVGGGGAVRGLVGDGIGALLAVVEEVENVAAPALAHHAAVLRDELGGDAVDGLAGADAVHVVGVGGGAAAAGHRGKPAALRPRHRVG